MINIGDCIVGFIIMGIVLAIILLERKIIEEEGKRIKQLKENK